MCPMLNFFFSLSRRILQTETVFSTSAVSVSMAASVCDTLNHTIAPSHVLMYIGIPSLLADCCLQYEKVTSGSVPQKGPYTVHSESRYALGCSVS